MPAWTMWRQGFLVFASTLLGRSSAEAAQATWVVMANHGSIGDSFAVANGAMALLGCPREHMVPRETWSLQDA